MPFLAPAQMTGNTIASIITPRATVAIQKTRRRRPRTAINLPAEDISKLDKEELKKIKNRIAAARARERSQQRVSELEAVIRELWGRVQYVEGVVQELQPNLTLRELYSGYRPQVQLSASTLTSTTGAVQAPNATFDLRELAWMFTAKEGAESS